jgi:hypothetical protein
VCVCGGGGSMNDRIPGGTYHHFAKTIIIYDTRHRLIHAIQEYNEDKLHGPPSLFEKLISRSARQVIP